MSGHILVMRVKNKLSTDECIKKAQRIESHLNGKYKVLIIDKNVQDIEFFEEPNGTEIAKETDEKIELEIEKGEK